MASAVNEREASTPWLRESRPESSAPPIEKMPQFVAALERFADRVGETLGAAFGAAFSASMETAESATTFAALTEHDGHVAAIMRSSSFDARLAMILDPRAVDTLIATMFGIDPAADGALPETEVSPRPRTGLETRLLIEFAQCVASALRETFAPVASFDMTFESLDTITDEKLLGPKNMPAILCRFAIETPAGALGLNVVAPRAFTVPLSDMFAREPPPGASKLDPNWTHRMEQRVSQANLTLTAILDEFDMSLADVSDLRVGRVLALSDDGQGRIRIECGERGVFICKLGEHNSRYALEVDDIIAHAPEPPYPGAPH